VRPALTPAALLLASLLLMTPIIAAAGTQPQGMLTLTSPLPELPAGGGTFYIYASLATAEGYAPLPQTPLIVSSSNESVLGVPSGEVTGGGYVPVPVIPTSPGTAVLTVSAPALGLSANVTLRVGYAIGYPERVALEPLPPSLLYGENGSIFVELVDAFGNPAPAPQGAVVHIYGYSPSLISHQATAVISPGSYMAYAGMEAGYSRGITDLVGIAQGFAPSSPVNVTTGRAEPGLSVTVMPNSVYSGAGYVMVLIQMLDPSGHPLIANSPVQVFLSSSNCDVVDPLSSYLTIPAGSDHVWAEAEVTGVGNASLTAQAQWFMPGSAAFRSVPGHASPNSITIYGPGVVALGQTYPLVLAATANGSAVSEIYPAVVTSSNPGVVSPWPVNASTYSSYIISTANETAQGVGSALLTASSQYLAPGNLTISAYEPGTYMGGTPTQLALYGPDRLISGTNAEFYVQLLTSYGSPAPAQSPADVLVQFYPAPGYVGGLPSPVEVSIPAGSSGSPFNVTIPGSGALTMVATAEGVGPASFEVGALSGPSPVQPYLVASIVPPQPMMGAQPILYLYLEDASGNLISPWAPVNVSVIGPDGFSAGATIPAGGFYASVPLPSMPVDTSWYLVASSGQLGTSARFNYSYIPLNLTVDAVSGMGTPVQGISVKVIHNGATIATVTTGSDGVGTIQLSPGRYSVVFPTSTSPAQGTFARFESTPNGTSSTIPVNLTSPATISAYYQVYYQVTALTAHGIVNGSGLFPQGSIDIVSVRPTEILGFPVGYTFTGWTGTYSASSPSVSLTVNSPQLLIANWKADWTLFYMVVAVIMIGAVAIAIAMINRRRGLAGLQP